MCQVPGRLGPDESERSDLAFEEDEASDERPIGAAAPPAPLHEPWWMVALVAFIP